MNYFTLTEGNGGMAILRKRAFLDFTSSLTGLQLFGNVWNNWAFQIISKNEYDVARCTKILQLGRYTYTIVDNYPSCNDDSDDNDDLGDDDWDE